MDNNIQPNSMLFSFVVVSLSFLGNSKFSNIDNNFMCRKHNKYTQILFAMHKYMIKCRIKRKRKGKKVHYTRLNAFALWKEKKKKKKKLVNAIISFGWSAMYVQMQQKKGEEKKKMSKRFISSSVWFHAVPRISRETNAKFTKLTKWEYCCYSFINL